MCVKQINNAHVLRPETEIMCVLCEEERETQTSRGASCMWVWRVVGLLVFNSGGHNRDDQVLGYHPSNQGPYEQRGNSASHSAHFFLLRIH